MRYITAILVTVVLLAACVPAPQQTCAPGLEGKTVVAPANATANKTAEKTEEKPVEKQEAKKADASKKEVFEGELVSFPNLKATDPDGDTLTYTFSAPLNASGMWQTKEGDAGEYNITITASDGKNEAKKQLVLVVTSKNKVPVITGVEDLTVNEGEAIELKAKATDADGDNVTLSYSGFMTGAKYTATYTDAGKHEVTITAADGKATVTKTITITVNNVNRAPTIDTLLDVVVKEGAKVRIAPTAKDPDGDSVSFAFSQPLDKNGEWQTKEGDAGKYRVNVTASDASMTAETKFFVVVEAENNAPVFEKLTAVNVEEGKSKTVDITATDADKDKLNLTAIELPSWAKFTADGGKGTLTLEPDYGAVTADKQYSFTFIAKDGKTEARTALTVTVVNVNRPPTFDDSSFG